MIFKKNTFIFLFLIIFCLFFCKDSRQKKYNKSFYCWQVNNTFNFHQTNLIKNLNVKFIYMKYFDVVWDKESSQCMPVAKLKICKNIPTSLKIIPVIFLTERSMNNITKKDIPLLAKNILQEIIFLSEKFSFEDFLEIQFDCDWDKSSKNNFFSFLREFKKIVTKKYPKCIISSTLRLHQAKYKNKTGIPPVEKVMLMFYNLQNPTKKIEGNSILDLKVGKRYIRSLKSYPLPMDIGLPVFSLGILYQGEEFIQLINDFKITEENKKYYQKIHNHYYLVKETHFFQGVKLLKNNIIRFENIDKELLIQAAKLIKKNISRYNYKNNNRNIILFHLNNHFIHHSTLEDIHEIFNSF